MPVVEFGNPDRTTYAFPEDVALERSDGLSGAGFFDGAGRIEEVQGV
jgi:hypothetical protein